jgi:hypothetical protein
MKEYLNKNNNINLIEQAVENLALSYDDWLELHCLSRANNDIKHPQTRISKQKAIEMIQTFKG